MNQVYIHTKIDKSINNALKKLSINMKIDKCDLINEGLSHYLVKKGVHMATKKTAKKAVIKKPVTKKKGK